MDKELLGSVGNFFFFWEELSLKLIKGISFGGDINVGVLGIGGVFIFVFRVIVEFMYLRNKVRYFGSIFLI